MPKEEFEKVVTEEFSLAVPEQFQERIRNLVFLIEDEPSSVIRQETGLASNQTLLGFYRGIPSTVRGDTYGVGPTLPDAIILYQVPLEEEARVQCTRSGRSFEECIRTAVRETIWHEVAHHFGFNERQVREKEKKRRT